MKRLTGKQRYTVVTRWRKEPLIVLEVEENSKGIVQCDSFGGMGLSYDKTYWRRAKIEDLTEVSNKEIKD